MCVLTVCLSCIRVKFPSSYPVMPKRIFACMRQAGAVEMFCHCNILVHPIISYQVLMKNSVAAMI